MGELQEVRVESSAFPARQAVRTIQLAPVVNSASFAARQARSRELALSIAEIVRRREGVSAAPPIAPASPPPVTPPAPPPVQTRSGGPGRWQVGLAPTFEHFAGGSELVGGDVFLGASLGRRVVAEIRVGGRAGTRRIVPGGSLSSSAATAGATAGVLLWPESRHVGLAFMLHAEEYFVRFRLENTAAGPRTVFLGAFVVAAGPRLTVALGSRVALEASAAVGFPPHGIVVRVQGTAVEGLTGLVLSGRLAGVLRF
jgi:hypothetical protein